MQGNFFFLLRRKILKNEHLSTLLPDIKTFCLHFRLLLCIPPQPNLRLFLLLLHSGTHPKLGPHQLLPFWVISSSKAVFSDTLNYSRMNACVQKLPYSSPRCTPPTSVSSICTQNLKSRNLMRKRLQKHWWDFHIFPRKLCEKISQWFHWLPNSLLLNILSLKAVIWGYFYL